MKRLVFLSFVLFFFITKLHTQNLIQNGSFENYTTPIDCIYGGFDNFNSPFNHVLNNWQCYNTPEYFNSYCNTSFSLPANYYGYSNAFNGNSYIGFVAYSGVTTEIKEYVYQQLSQPLQVGKSYCLIFYISRGDASRGAIKNIGAYFSSTLPSMVSSAYINVIPQIENQNGFITDTIGWTQIQGCYTANGGEQYITIGNFNSNANTDTMTTSSNYAVASNFPGWSYYYIDDVTLIDQSTVGINELSNGSSFEVYPNPTNSILNIKSNNQQLQNATIEIKNTLGQLVYFDIYTPQIHISYLPSGIYFITLNHKETKRTIKFVKD